MEEEQGEDSEVLDAMDGWDSEEENPTAGTDAASTTNGATTIKAEEIKIKGD